MNSRAAPVRRAVIDASTLMAALLPDEPLRPAARRILAQFVEGLLDLIAPPLLVFELANGLLKAERNPGRTIDRALVDEIVEDFYRLDIPMAEVGAQAILDASRLCECWAYDGSYIALAEGEGVPLITADRRLYNMVHTRFHGIVWVEDFAS